MPFARNPWESRHCTERYPRPGPRGAQGDELCWAVGAARHPEALKRGSRARPQSGRGLLRREWKSCELCDFLKGHLATRLGTALSGHTPVSRGRRFRAFLAGRALPLAGGRAGPLPRVSRRWGRGSDTPGASRATPV